MLVIWLAGKFCYQGVKLEADGGWQIPEVHGKN